MDQHLPTHFSTAPHKRPALSYDTDSMYMTFGPDSTQLVRRQAPTTDQQRFVRETSSQMDYVAPPLEEFDRQVRARPANHQASRRMRLDRGDY